MQHKRKFSPIFQTVGPNKYPNNNGDRYYAQDLARDTRYLESLPGRIATKSLGVESIFLSGGIVTEGSSKTQINITGAVGICSFDVDVVKDGDPWAIPAPTEIAQIKKLVECPNVTNFSLAGATLNGVATNYVKLRYKELNVQTRNRQFETGSYAYSIEDSYEIICNTVANTEYDILLATLIGNGSTTLTITQILTNKHSVPIGFIYIQFPTKALPATLYPGTTWTDRSSSFAGNFFRAAGGNALGFEAGEQAFQNYSHSHGASSGNDNIDHSHPVSGSTGNDSPDHSHATTFYNNNGGTGTNPYGSVSSSSFSVSSGGASVRHTHPAQGSLATGSRSAYHQHNITVNADGGAGEARPVNRTIRIWERTA